MAQMQKLEQATQKLEGEQAQQALKDLEAMQQRLREQLEKSAEMLKRAAMEGAMQTLKDEAKEIAERAEDRRGPLLDEPRRLDVTTLSRMEAFLGDDLSGVRVHTGPGAAEVTRRLGADAVTVRDHVFFAPGRFNPATAEGEKLIAHELTHVLQKGRRLDVRAAEAEALHAEHSYGRAPAMETLNLGRPPPDFRLPAEGEGTAAPAGIQAAKRTRSRGHEAGGKDELPDGEEFLEQVGSRVYEMLIEELEHSFESR